MRCPGVHGDGADEGDVDAEGTVDSGTVEAEYGAEGYGCPLRVFHATVAAFVIAWYGFDHGLVTGGHLHHFDWYFIDQLVQ